MVEIETSERLFRALGLSGFITVMDTVHMTYDRDPFPVRHLFMGKEGYPTVGVNMHSNALGWVKHVGSIFPGSHNDKTVVCFDKLVTVMHHDTLFTSYKWDTTVTDTPGETFKLCGECLVCVCIYCILVCTLSRVGIYCYPYYFMLVCIHIIFHIIFHIILSILLCVGVFYILVRQV